MQTLLKKASFVVLMWTLSVFPMVAHAGTLHVSCDSKKGLTRIQRAIDILQQDGSAGTNTILVSGSCKENITIQSMDNLTLTAQNGALQVGYSIDQLDLSGGYRPEYFKVRQPTFGIAADTIASQVAQALTNQSWVYQMPDSASPFPDYRLVFQDFIAGSKTFRFEMALQKK